MPYGFEKLSEYWAAVRNQETELHRNNPSQDAFYITSLPGGARDWKAGAVFMAIAAHAAQRIIERTHRLSTPEEIAQYKEAEAGREAKYRQLREEKRPLSVVLSEDVVREAILSHRKGANAR
ncbi:MAG: hypothetical protein WA324_19915 [Bryobacteraceae bacterium]